LHGYDAVDRKVRIRYTVCNSTSVLSTVSCISGGGGGGRGEEGKRLNGCEKEPRNVTYLVLQCEHTFDDSVVRYKK